MPFPSHLPRKSPALVLPASSRGSNAWWLYDGYPAEQEWADYLRRKVVAHPRRPFSWKELTSLETGAPVGPFDEQSFRVARAIGLLAPESARSHDAVTISGACFAQSICYAQLDEDGSTVRLTFHFPESISWGTNSTPQSSSMVVARCLRQFMAQAQSLLSRLKAAGAIDSVALEFAGAWGSEWGNYQASLTSLCNQACKA